MARRATGPCTSFVHVFFQWAAAVHVLAGAHEDTPADCPGSGSIPAEQLPAVSLLQTGITLSRQPHEFLVNEAAGAASFEESPFAHVLLLVTRIHADKVPAIDAAYRPHFWDTVYVGPRAASNETSLLRAQGFAVDDCSDYQEFDRGWLDMTYPCVARVLLGLARPDTLATSNALESRLRAKTLETPLRGVLVMQADFWISPSFWRGLDLDRIWHLPSVGTCDTHDNIASNMTAAESALLPTDKMSRWWRNHTIDLKLRDAAMASLRSQSLGLNTSMICMGWSDMYYVPQQLWSTWSQVAGIVGQKLSGSMMANDEGRNRSHIAWSQKFPNTEVLMNELAVPLIIDVVSEHGTCKVGRCATELVTTCWGGTHNITRDPAHLQQYPCGHQMDLRSSQIREGLLALWPSSGRKWDLSSPHLHLREGLSTLQHSSNADQGLLSSQRSSSKDPQRTAKAKYICAALVFFTAVTAFVCARWLMPLVASHMVSVCGMALYVVVSVTIDLLIMVQKNTDHRYKFNPLCAIILTELTKVVFSVAAHLAKGPSHGPCLGPRLSDACWMCLPAACYTLNNVLVFVSMAMNGSATFGIFRDTVVLWTAACWYLAYKVPLKSIRILGIVILCVGLCINRFTAVSDAAGSKWAFLSVVLMTLCNALGAVTNELALKRNAELDINVQNMMLYMLCATTSMFVLTLSDPVRLSSVHSFFEGFTRHTVLMVALQASAGLLISRLLKYADAVYKSVGSCLRGPVLVVIAPLFLHQMPNSAATLVSAFVVACGSFVYLSQGPLSASASQDSEAKTIK